MILHRNSNKHIAYADVEEIIEILDQDYDHHKGYSEYKVRFIKHYQPELNGYIIWLKAKDMSDFVEVPKNHPAYLLYGKNAK